MTHGSINDIYIDGNIVENHKRYTRFLTPRQPLKFDANKWVYHEMPDVLTFKADMMLQQKHHRAQESYHLNFDFPEDTPLSQDMLRFLRASGFELGCIEMYAIEGDILQKLTDEPIDLKKVTHQTVQDYMNIFNIMGEPYGEDYLKEAGNHIIEQVKLGTNKLDYYVAYDEGAPVGILNLISTCHTLEIDGFAVKPEQQRRGIGTRMQAQVGKFANQRLVILVADAEDTVKDMYVKQGYTYLHFRYSALLEMNTRP